MKALLNPTYKMNPNETCTDARKCNTIQKRYFGFFLFLLIGMLSHNAIADPVVVGRVNPDTLEVTIFKDILKKNFKNGTAIQYFYGRYFESSKEFLMVRSGKSQTGNCQTDAFKLVRISNNRLALAVGDPTLIPWDGQGLIPQLRKCFSGQCSGHCLVEGDTSTVFDSTDYICRCSSNSGECEQVFKTADQLLDDIVWQELLP